MDRQARHAQGAGMSPGIPLDDIKALGRRAGATVNDVLLAAISGGCNGIWRRSRRSWTR